MDEPTTSNPIPDITQDFTEDFASVYANNFHFEISAWDLKIILGQLNQAAGKSGIDWHTAVTMPWGAAKLLSYLLRLNIAIYESNNGLIRMHPGTVPEAPIPPTGDQDTEQNRAFYEIMSREYKQLTGS